MRGEITMKRCYVSILFMLLVMFVIFLLPACSYTARLSSGEIAVIVDESVDVVEYMIEDVVADEEPGSLENTHEDAIVDESHNSAIIEQIYEPLDIFVYDVQSHCSGGWWECGIHSGAFHTFDDFTLEGIVSVEDLRAWSIPLLEQRSSPYDECLVNLSTFIDYFGITRERFQQFVDGLSPTVRYAARFNIDVLFSGDRELIERFYSIDNIMLHQQMLYDGEYRYLAERIKYLQQIVNDNTVEMSRYFHDIWTYASFMRTGGQWMFLDWMQNLVDTGEYERVNMVEFVSYFGLPRSTLEQFIEEFDMHLFTHYNLDVIFSGDQQLIQNYYSIENEATHTAQVQETFERYAATHGSPDTSWMLDR